MSTTRNPPRKPSRRLPPTAQPPRRRGRPILLVPLALIVLAGAALVGVHYATDSGSSRPDTSSLKFVELAKSELGKLGLADPTKVEKGYVTRVPKAYPMYDADYAERVDAIREWLETVPNLIQVGRNGLHRYNNSDHSMLTAIRAVENITQGTQHDIWAVNAESVYHEEDVADEHPYRRAPETKSMREPLVQTGS